MTDAYNQMLAGHAQQCMCRALVAADQTYGGERVVEFVCGTQAVLKSGVSWESDPTDTRRESPA